MPRVRGVLLVPGGLVILMDAAKASLEQLAFSLDENFGSCRREATPLSHVLTRPPCPPNLFSYTSYDWLVWDLHSVAAVARCLQHEDNDKGGRR